ncbi:hypothetical protein [Belnapia rosea]|uniref:hypothetical protein n=1 Tax=Belnapia rosea TaxID=938405 RepID=UPI00088F6F1B|nr:hypothetical protein [Belnapia rosea]SDB72048.1 Tripartite-type tricarboxylate transporter, receptor component TctC [Belnapia rosea]
MAQGPRQTRRCLLAAPALAALLPFPAIALLPATATLLVPGPEDGTLAEWSGRLAAALARGASTAMMLERSILGGPDGVTAANRFATAAAPDGRTLLVLPGAAAQARLVGDQRARFDGAGWVPVCAVQGPVVLARRAGLATGMAPIRLGLAAPDHAGTAALLGLDLIGHAAIPVFGLAGARAEAALAQGAVDAVLFQGGELPARLAAAGARPWFVLDEARDPALPDVPAAGELATGGDAALRAALTAAAVNARLLGALLLPALTPADLVALWRAAAQRWLEDERSSLAPGIRLSAGADLTPVLGPLAPPPMAVLAYREWLFRRLRWKPD